MNLNMLYETVRQALKNIASNKFRTLLTMLGIIIGIMAVMIIVGLGNGLTQSMRDSVSSMGMNLLQVNVFGPRARNVDIDEMYAITEERPDLFSGISPIVNMDRTSSAVKVGTKSFSQTTAIGVSEAYAGMTGTTIAKGRGIQFVDCAEYKRVCVVGDYIDRVGYGGNAVGQTIKLGAQPVHHRRGGRGGSGGPLPAGRQLGRLCLHPLHHRPAGGPQRYRIFLRRHHRHRGTGGGGQGRAGGRAAGADPLGGQLLCHQPFRNAEHLQQHDRHGGVGPDRHRGHFPCWWGGIGIMNIMMVSVAERTREIGIRKALGAKERTILALFVTEAATTSALGGLIGIVLGYGVSAAASPLVAALMGDTNMSISPSPGSVAVAFGVSVGIGVLFGYLPAKRAARLNPIEALRYD